MSRGNSIWTCFSGVDDQNSWKRGESSCKQLVRSSLSLTLPVMVHYTLGRRHNFGVNFFPADEWRSCDFTKFILFTRSSFLADGDLELCPANEGIYVSSPHPRRLKVSGVGIDQSASTHSRSGRCIRKYIEHQASPVSTITRRFTTELNLRW